MATRRPTKDTLEASDDPARLYIRFIVVDVPATATDPAHSSLCWICTFCDQQLAWCSWNRCRGHLCGDSILGLAHGAKACQNVTPEVQEIFKKILVDARDKKTEKGVVKRALDRAAAESSIAGTKSSKRQSLINQSFEVGRNFFKLDFSLLRLMRVDVPVGLGCGRPRREACGHVLRVQHSL